MQPFPDEWSQRITDAVARLRPAVVHVRIQYPDEDGVTVGSGVLVDNYHVVTVVRGTGKPREITVVTHDGRRHGATVVGADPLYFLLVLRLDKRVEWEPPSLARSDQLKPGQLVVAVGTPFGIDHNVAVGVISGAERTIYRPERFPVDGLVITDAAIHPGNNGGALGWLNGELVGINGIPMSEHLGLAVQADVAARVANQIIEYGAATHPWLGFSGEPEVIDPKLVELMQLPVDRGVVVAYVAPGGPGERAGIRELDMVVRVEDKPVAGGVGAIRKALAGFRPGQSASLTVLRGGELVDLRMPVEEMPRLRPLNH